MLTSILLPLVIISAPAPIPRVRVGDDRFIGVWLVQDATRVDVWTFTNESVPSENGHRWKRWYYFIGYPVTWHYHEKQHRAVHRGKWIVQGKYLIIEFDNTRITHEIGTKIQKIEELPDGPYFPNASIGFIRRITNYELERAK